MKLLGLTLLFVISLLMIDANDAFAGGSEYDNRANAFWLQFYVTVVAIVGTVVAMSMVGYKIRKRKTTSKICKK